MGSPDYLSILRLDEELNQVQDLDILLEKILLESRKIVGADAGSIYVKRMTDEKEKENEELQIRYSQNNTIQKSLPPNQKMVYSIFTVPINEKSISGYCALTRTIINIPDMYNIPPDAPYSFNPSFDRLAGYKTISTLTFPLVSASGRFFGVIQLINKTDSNENIVPFSDEDELIISHFATSATIALERAYITRTMVLRMTKMAKLRDPKETGTHVNRVAGYTVEIYDHWANKYDIPQEEREKFRDILRIGAMLHDVGKVAISDIILKKPGRFTSEEFGMMQYHTLCGAELFDDPQSSLDDLARDIALTHHENWDGTGYPGWVNPISHVPEKTNDVGEPLGRKGEEIPLAGRIVAIADVFDALCSKRAYKEAWSEEQVLEEMHRMTATKFDPELVKIFFEILPVIKLTQSMYPEDTVA